MIAKPKLVPLLIWFTACFRIKACLCWILVLFQYVVHVFRYKYPESLLVCVACRNDLEWHTIWTKKFSCLFDKSEVHVSQSNVFMMDFNFFSCIYIWFSIFYMSIYPLHEIVKMLALTNLHCYIHYKQLWICVGQEVGNVRTNICNLWSLNVFSDFFKLQNSLSTYCLICIVSIRGKLCLCYGVN